MRQDPNHRDAGVSDDREELLEAFVLIDEDAAAGELLACLDRMASEIGDYPELLDDLRWEIQMMKIRTGRARLH